MNKLFKSISNSLARMVYGLIILMMVVGAGGSSTHALKPENLPVDNSFVTDTWAVEVAAGTDPELLASQLGAENLGPVGALTNIYLFRLLGSDSHTTLMADALAANGQVKWFEQQVAQQQSKRDLVDNPSYGAQWYLHAGNEADINVEGAWTLGYTGTGVTIGIVDDGLQYSHPDLSGHYESLLDWDFNDNDNDPVPSIDTDFHGTSVAGVAAGNNNTTCGVGAAYDASLAGLRLTAGSTTDAEKASALNLNYNDISIYNNSWGPLDDGLRLEGPGPLTLAALQNGVTNGRAGKGSIFVWSAGNGLTSFDNINYDGYANSRFVIAVGAVTDSGDQAPYSEPGAAMFVTAPSSGGEAPDNGIASVDLLGSDGYNSGDCATDTGTGDFGGTSSSAPLVAGVVALMLEANPNLTWRDVKHILAETAAKNDPLDSDWYTNDAGLHVNHKYGFGLVDAQAAVNAALTWTNVAPEVNVSSGLIPVSQSIPDNDATGINSSFFVTQDFKVEEVEVVFNSTHTYRGDLKLILTSPSGTESVLADQHNDANDNFNSWKFTTVRNWNESATGIWTLKVADIAGVGVGTFDSWRLNVYGVGSNFPNPWVGGMVVDADESVVAIGRPEIDTQFTTYNGFNGGSTTVYVPMLFKDAFGGTYDTALYIQNLHASNTATIAINYYDSNGNLTCTINDTIARLSSKGYWLPGTSCLPVGWVGGAVITADQNIVAVGRPHIGSEILTYNGFASGSTTMYVPMLFKDAFGGTYDAALYIQNLHPSTTANIAIKYYDTSGILTCTVNDTLARLSSKGYWLPGTPCLPVGWIGAAVVTASQNIVAVGRPHIGEQIMAYNGFASGLTNAYVPTMFKDASGGTYDSALYVQNVHPTNTANIAIKYYDTAGNLTCTVNDTIARLSSKGYWLPATGCLPPGWEGSVKVESDLGVIAVGRPHLGAEIMTYDGASTGSLLSYVPMLFRDAFGGGYDASIYFLNTDASNSANLTLTFYDANGNLSCTRSDVIPPQGSLNHYLPITDCN